MADFMKEDKIRAWGISEANEEYLRRADAVCPVAAVENRYSIMARWHKPLFPVIEELDVALAAFSPLANGFLTGAYSSKTKLEGAQDYRLGMPQYTEEGERRARPLIELITQLAEKHPGSRCSDIACLDALQEALDRADSGQPQAGAPAPVQRNGQSGRAAQDCRGAPGRYGSACCPYGSLPLYVRRAHQPRRRCPREHELHIPRFESHNDRGPHPHRSRCEDLLRRAQYGCVEAFRDEGGWDEVSDHDDPSGHDRQGLLD